MSYDSRFNPDDYPIIVGIDFGTTFSGCCYAFAQNEELIDIVKWPKQTNSIYPKNALMYQLRKTPTLSLYQKGSINIIDWGYGAKRAALKPNSADLLLLSKFKLYLDERLENELLPNGLNVIDVIAEYLYFFHNHVCSEMAKSISGVFDQSKFRYCLTVPAMWTDRAKAAMREAAIRAGIILRTDPPERLSLISEPEAAALYCEKKSEQFNLTHGQRFMICDAGGGTVDLIVFEIDKKYGRSRTLKEATNGHGASCGSGFLDVRMKDYITRKFAHIGPINPQSMDLIMDIFINTIKPEFNGIEDHFLTLPASMGFGDITDISIGLEKGTILLPAHELRSQVFEPVVLQVLDLIESQLQQSPNLEAIFLIGGFGQSNYLFNRIEDTFTHRVGMIGVPPRGELAVVRGAVYFGLSPRTISERVSRRTYGVETRMLFQNELDPPDYAVVGVDGRNYCRHRFSVYVRKGQRVKIDECISKTFVISYPNNTDSDLYAYDEDGTPPRHTSDPAIQKVGHFPIRMPRLEGVMIGDKVSLTIQMFFGLTEIKIKCNIRGQVFVFTSAFETTDFASLYSNQNQSRSSQMLNTPNYSQHTSPTESTYINSTVQQYNNNNNNRNSYVSQAYQPSLTSNRDHETNQSQTSLGSDYFGQQPRQSSQTQRSFYQFQNNYSDKL